MFFVMEKLVVMFSPTFFILVFLATFFNCGFAFQLKIQCDDPIVLGATLNCTTWVYNDDGKTLADGTFKYLWRDDAIPQSNREVVSGPNVDTWLVAYNASIYTAGTYVIRVNVCKWYINMFCTYDNSAGTFFYITDSLNGQMTLSQLNETRDTFVSTSGTLKNNVVLKTADKNYIDLAPTVLSYWFVDCVYYGITTDLEFDYNFTKPDEDHVIESLVVGDFSPLPPPTTVPPPTTSTTPTTTTKGTTTTSTPPTTTTKKPIAKSTTTMNITMAKTPTTEPTTAKPNPKAKREAPTIPAAANSTVPGKNDSSNETQSNIKIWQNGTLVPYNGTFPYVCNSTVITTDNKKVYGYFQKVITTKAPVSNVSVSGNNWLQHGELLSLNIKCTGSSKMQFCYYFKPGLYNVTGNETCSVYSDLEQCDFPINRYFQDQHTVIIIIKNDVSKRVTSVAVTVYKVKQQAQLSVIVVPVAFSLVAVVTIVFGVAYYLQNRSRFVVEVADFDFGPKYADMEYKTFKDRLKDSIVNAFTRDPMPSTSDAPIWPPGHKYGSMT